MAEHHFDLSPNACTVCHEAKENETIVACLACRAHTHVDCYARATTTREWACDMCDASLVGATCALCGLDAGLGIMQRLSTGETFQMNAFAANSYKQDASQPTLAHAFCVRLWQHPQAVPLDEVRRTNCTLCHQTNARLQCHACASAFHPTCALASPRLLSFPIVGSDQIRISCKQHRAGQPPPGTRLPSGSAAVSLARPSKFIEAAPLPTLPQLSSSSSSVTAALPAAMRTPARSPVPLPPHSGSSVTSHRANATPPGSGGGSSVHSLQSVRSAAISSSSTIPSHGLIPVAPAPLGRPSKRAEAFSNFAAAATEQPVNSSSAAAAPIAVSARSSRAKLVRIRPLSSEPSDGSPAAAAPAAAASVPSISSTSSVTPSVSKMLAASYAARSAATASKSRPTSPEFGERKQSDTSPARAKKAVSSKATPSKKLSSSSSSPSKQALPAKRKRSRSPPVAAASSKKQSPESDPDIIYMSSSEEDEKLPHEFLTEKLEKKRQERAKEEIKQAREEEKAAPDEACQVCGEEWAEDHKDLEGNLILDENGEPVTDEMVQCGDGKKGCDKYFHQSCYGIPDVPEDDWYCRPCEVGIIDRTKMRCVICHGSEDRGWIPVQYDPKKTDPRALRAAKRKAHGHWAHVICAFWFKQVEFGDPATRTPALHVEDIPKEAYKLHCILCARREGAALQCQYKECVVSFHPICMMGQVVTKHRPTPRLPGKEMFVDDHADDPDLPDGLRPEKEHFCPRHSVRPLLEKQKKELEAEGKDTSEIDAKLAAPPDPVHVTTELLPPEKLVGYVPPKMRRGKRLVLECDPSDQEARAAEWEKSQDVKNIKKEELADDDDEDNDIDMTTAPAAAASSMRGKRRSARGIDDDVDEDIESDTSSDSAANARKRLKKVTPRLKLESAHPMLHSRVTPSNHGQDRLQSPILASSHPLSTSYRPSSQATTSTLGDLMTDVTNPTIVTRSRARQSLTDLVGASHANAIEEALFRSNAGYIDQHYLRRSRDLISNLKLNNNLAQRIYSGDLTAERLVAMTNAEMAPEALQRKRAAEAKEDIREHISASEVTLVKPGGEKLTVPLSKA